MALQRVTGFRVVALGTLEFEIHKFIQFESFGFGQWNLIYVTPWVHNPTNIILLTINVNHVTFKDFVFRSYSTFKQITFRSDMIIRLSFSLILVSLFPSVTSFSALPYVHIDFGHFFRLAQCQAKCTEKFGELASRTLLDGTERRFFNVSNEQYISVSVH